MIRKKRNRSRPSGSLAHRLRKFADDKRHAARKMPPGPERETLMKKARQSETVMEVSDWLMLRK